MLKALPFNRLSKAAKKRLAELTRNADAVHWEIGRPIRISVGAYKSPLSLEVARKMRDKQWLSAIGKHSSNESREKFGDEFIGGASEFSGILEKLTGQDPVRFAKLMLSFPSNSNPHYFNAVFMGLRNGWNPMREMRVFAPN